MGQPEVPLAAAFPCRALRTPYINVIYVRAFLTKAAFITGASSRVGRLVTERMLARGDRVVGIVRREGSLNADTRCMNIPEKS
jgi:hypothetical protein